MKISLLTLLTLFIHPLTAMERKYGPSDELWKFFYYTHHQRNHTPEQLNEKVQAFIKAGADINFKPTYLDSKPLLILATEKLKPELCEVALANGADLITQDEKTSVLIKLASAAQKRKSDWDDLSHEPGMLRLINPCEVPIFKTAFVLIKHMVRRHMAGKRTAIRTFILCLTRMGRSDYRIGGFTRSSNALLMPYCMFNAKASCKEMLLEELSKRNGLQHNRGLRAWDIYPCELLNPECVEDIIDRVLRPDKLQAEIDRE
jgi:hypothetical protein